MDDNKMRLPQLLSALAVGVMLASACGDDTETKPAPSAEKTWASCQASHQAFVRKALLALNGRRAASQAEVDVYEDVILGFVAAGSSERDAKLATAELMMAEGLYYHRWGNFFMDQLRVQRGRFVRDSNYNQVETQRCYGDPPAGAVDGGELAAYVRDSYPTEAQPPVPNFTMGQLLNSSLVLDDLSPLYRAQLFHMMVFPISGANLDELELEAAQRDAMGVQFEEAYLTRDVACILCHNSESSTTYDPDPQKNRWWPVRGNFEKALYGTSNGGGALTLLEKLRFRSVWRVADVVVSSDDGGSPVWGWDGEKCGSFKVPNTVDPLDIDAAFGSVRSTPDNPQAGKRASVWGMETMLRNGFEGLHRDGLDLTSSNDLINPDEALAHLVAQSIVNDVWEEVVGSRLTIANYFPRNEVQRDVLEQLTTKFIESRYSLKTLLREILVHPVFNLAPPSDACWEEPYEVPALFDPWSRDETDPERRLNSAADGIFSLSPRVMLTALHSAMRWPLATAFPADQNEEAFQATIGLFLDNSRPGFRTLDFEGRLAWEAEYGACSARVQPDFIADLGTRAVASGATVGDAVVVLKDRLIGDAAIEPDEVPHLEALVGSALSSTDLSTLDRGLRRVCGVFVASPQFVMGGTTPSEPRGIPKLTDPRDGYASLCAEVAARADVLGSEYQLTCAAEHLAVATR